MRLIDSADRTARATTDLAAQPVQHGAPAIIPAVKRRGALRLLGAGGIAFVATVAGMAETAKPAAAATVSPSYCNSEYCCDLYYLCTVCWGRLQLHLSVGVSPPGMVLPVRQQHHRLR